ncbi:MAG: prenyltransferase/squalene oxidase repeat-containing protein [Anaerolineae bacterium]
MKLRYNPFPWIFEQGDERTKLASLAFFGQADSPQSNTCVLSLLKQQRPDGAFPSRFDAETWGMQETIRYTLLMLKVGMPATGVNVSRAVRFVLNWRNPDGGWCENPALELPPGQTWLSSQQSITWLTADVVDLLRQVDMGECPECTAALGWLRAVQNADGGWPSLADPSEDCQSDPDATAQIAFLMAKLVGVLLGSATPQRAQRLAEIFRPCPYCASFAIAGCAVMGLYVFPPHHRWWLESIEDLPRETLGLERAEVFFARQVAATSPWSRGEVQPVLEKGPCGADCRECPNYRQKCSGCPGTRHYTGTPEG